MRSAELQGRIVPRTKLPLTLRIPHSALRTYDSPVPRKYFTLAEANRTLPLVKRIVADIVALHPQWRDLVARYELVAAKAKPDWGEPPEQIALRRQVDAIAHQINDYLVELQQIGCVFKGFEQGLVDFYGN